jgi:hypothetical protein
VDAALTMLARHDANGISSRLARASFAVNPALSYTRSELEEIAAELERVRPKNTGEALARLHAVALIAARLERLPELRAYAREFGATIERAENPRAHAGSLAGLNARIAMLAGRPDSALAHLASTRNQVWFGWSIGSTYWSQVADRYLRAELLRDAGRLAEADRWYRSIEEFSVNDLAYLSSARARRAEIRLIKQSPHPRR